MNVTAANGLAGPAITKNSSENPSIIAALDIGSTKIVCLIGEVLKIRRRSGPGNDGRGLRVRGVGHHAARGVRGGVVTDLEAAEKAIRLAVDAAERMAGVSIGQVYVNISGGRPRNDCWRASTRTGGQVLTGNHIDRVVALAMARIDAGNRIVLHTSPAQFELDDARGVTRPEGMFAEQLSVDLNAVTVEPGALRNLARVIERCHLSAAGFVMAPYAAGRSVLMNDELELGTALVEMGGATTSVAIFAGGNLVSGDVLPVGGAHITSDLARGLSTTLVHAERLKTLFGSTLSSMSDEREIISMPLLGEGARAGVNKVPRSMLTGIIRSRVEEILEMVRDRLERDPAVRRAGGRVVLAGGASQLTGLREVASQILNRHVRLGVPQALVGLPEAARSPGFSVATGLLNYAMKPDHHVPVMPGAGTGQAANNNYLIRVGRWIKESF